MGYSMTCDECGVVMGDQMDRTHVSRDSLKEGSLRLDLCDKCSEGVRKVPVMVKKQKELKEKIEQSRIISQQEPDVPVKTR